MMRRTLAFILICLLLLGTIPIANAAGSITYTVYLKTGTYYADWNMEAIRNAVESAESGKTLYIKIGSSGKYYVGDGNRAWRLRSDTTFDLNGATLVRYGSQGNLFQNSDYDGDPSYYGGYSLSHDITIKNGMLDGAGGNGSNVNVCNFGHASRIKIQNVDFRNGNSHLIEFSGCSDCTVSGCTFSGYSKGTNDAVEAIQFDISDNSVSYKQWNGVYRSDSTPCRRMTVNNCTFYDFPSGVGNHKGIYGNHNTGIVIKNSRFCNSMSTKRPAIWSYDFNDSEISGNTITGNYSEGVYVSANKNTVIKNNQIKISGTGIKVTLANSYVRGYRDRTKEEYCSKCSVTGNTVTAKGKNDGIHVYSKSGVSNFNSNKVTASGSIGVTFSSGSKVTNCKKNTIKAAKGTGMLLATSAQVGEISGNKITSKKYAIQITSKTTVKKIKNNSSVTSTASDGIFVSSGGNAKSITGNTVKSCKGNGILITSSGKTAAITGNTVKSCKQYGIRVNNRGLKISFKKNKFIGNKAGKYKISAKIKSS